MHITADISLYPLTTDFIPPIDAFIARLHTYTDLQVVTNSASTQITGEYDLVMKVLVETCGPALGLDSHRAVIVTKFLRAD